MYVTIKVNNDIDVHLAPKILIPTILLLIPNILVNILVRSSGFKTLNDIFASICFIVHTMDNVIFNAALL